MAGMNCEDGICRVDGGRPEISIENNKDMSIIYVGDPMCSWCYGISPVVSQLQQYCDNENITFEIVVGGLRAGGGDAWNDQFKSFLRNEWQTIERVTGQPFQFDLLTKDYFNYDTEPACRAIVVAKGMLPEDNEASLSRFFQVVQRKFYCDNEDPKDVNFYQSICKSHNIHFAEFKTNFESDDAKSLTIEAFKTCRSLGVRGFPSFVMIKEGKIILLASGYTKFHEIIEKLEQL